jgi:cytoskeletal protein RodZ
MDVGGTLRQARLRKRLTLQQIAHSTKISQGTLEALEDNDFDRLPAGVYTRGFLRAFAREVDLDPEETVEQYMEQVEAVPAMSMAPERAEVAHDEGRDEASQTRTIIIPRVPLPALAAIVVIVAAGIYLVSSTRSAQVAATNVAEASTAPAPVPTPAPPADVARAANLDPDVLRIELTAIGPCWVSATADRESALSRLLQAGERHELQAKDEIVLRVGDPSTVAITVNGVPARSLGRPRQPVTVQINKRNFREYLSS